MEEKQQSPYIKEKEKGEGGENKKEKDKNVRYFYIVFPLRFMKFIIISCETKERYYLLYEQFTVLALHWCLCRCLLVVVCSPLLYHYIIIFSLSLSVFLLLMLPSSMSALIQSLFFCVHCSYNYVLIDF